MIRRILFVIAVILSSTGLVLSHAQAQNGPQEKRIAFVVGNGAYQKDPLQTTANDAGLIAQTLQAAGFDVIGARDLDGETLRRSFRDFIQKAQSSGPDTVAFVYLAGYGVQLTGENYFVPTDANIVRDTDVPVEALRIADYMRQLSALPLKAGVIVLDAARANPFVKEGQPLAGGLALVEPDPKILVAFNAAPGTVAPEGQPPYGAYAQALAEMIRAGGLTLPEVFDRVRLRVNETTQGAQIPWDTQKVDSRFVFFERAPDAPPVADQSAALRSKPIRDFSAQEAFTAAIERDTLQDYENFLVAFPNDPLAKRVRAIVAARREAITWRRTYRTDTPAAYWSYLDRYPRGPHAADARRRLAILAAALEPPPTYERFVYDVPPPPPDEIIYVDRPALYFSDPVFAFAPPPPPPVYYLPPPPPDFVVLPPPPPPVGIFILPIPRFVPIPVYVRAPAYVAPPPDNIIFKNIHNTTVINTVINNPAPPPQPVAPAPGGAPDIVKTDGSRPVAPGVAAVAAGAAAAAIAIPAAAAALPPAAAQKANVIRQQQPPVAPAAVTTPATLPQTAPGVQPPQPPAPQKSAITPPAPATPTTNPNLHTLPGAGGQPLPKQNQTTLPAGTPPPGAKGLPVNPALQKQPGATPAATAPTATAPAGSPTPTAPAASPGAGTPPTTAPGKPPAPSTANVQPGQPVPPSATAPVKPLPGAQEPKQVAPGTRPVAATPPPGQPAVPAPGQTPKQVQPPAAPATATAPAHVAPRVTAPTAPSPSRVAPPQSAPRVAAPSPPPPRMAPPQPPRITAPPPRVAAPTPPPPSRVAPPPPPRAAVPPPPPRVAAPSPPPPRMAPPPPPPPRAAPPPPPPRVAAPPPPPPPRMAPPPPPRPQPAPAAAARPACPPNVPADKCKR